MQFPATTATVSKLDSGLQLILLPDPSSPVVSVQAWVGTGSIHEGRWLGAGMSHLLEHMVFKGTRSFTGDELARTVQAAGGQWNAYTTYDRTVYYIDGPARSVGTFLKAVGEMVFHPTLPAGEFEREKDVIRREIEMGLDDPGHAAHQLLFNTIYHRDARRFPVIGQRERFDLIGHADMAGYHRQRYAPDQVVLCLVGDFDPQTVRSQAEELIEGLASSHLEFQQPPMEPAQQGSRHAEDEFDIPNTQMALAWRGPALENPDTPALDLLASILGQGRSSLLYQQHREGSGRALEIGAWTYQSRDLDGIFAISAECEPGQREALADEIRRQLAGLATSDFEKQLSRCKRAALSSQFGTLTTASGRASDLAKNWHEARNLDFTRDYLEALEAVTTDDLLRVRDTWLLDRSLTRTCMNPRGTTARVRAAKVQPGRDAPRLHTLDNGMRVILIRDRRIPLVAAELVALGGTAVEDSEQAGIGTLMGSTLLKGTKSRPAQEVASCLEDLGGSLNSYSGNNSFGLKLAFLKDDLATAVELAGEIFREASFPAEAVERERRSQLSSLRRQLVDPLSLGFLETRKRLFSGSSYALPNLGTESSLSALEQNDLRAHLERLRDPARMVLALAGDIDPDVVMDSAEVQFGGIARPGHPADGPAPPCPEAGESTRTIDGKQQAVLTIAFPGLPADHPERPALDLFTAYASDMAGPLFTRIREELGLAYYVSVNALCGLNCGGLTFFLGTSPEQLDLASSELRGQIEKFASQGIPADDFERARNSHLATIALSQQANRAVAQASALDTLTGLGHDHYLHAADRISSLDRGEVNRLVRRLLGQQPVTTRIMPGAVLQEPAGA